MTPGPELFAVDEVRGLALRDDESAELQDLLERCGEYFALIHAAPVRDDEALILIRELPEGFERSAKHVIGLRAGSRLLGVATVLCSYPLIGTWFLGDLLLAPESRGRGLGARVYRALEAWAHRTGATAIQLIVQNQNESALRFWRRMGFTWVESSEQRLNHAVNVIHRMQRNLT